MALKNGRFINDMPAMVAGSQLVAKLSMIGRRKMNTEIILYQMM